MYNISFKVYNNDKLKYLHSRINTAAFIWNHCIALQKRYHRLYSKYINVYKLKKHIAKLRNKNPRWRELTAQSVQEIVERVDTSYQRFFKKLALHPPKFKKPKNFNSFVFKQCGYKLKDNTLTVNKVGNFKFYKSREYENVKRVAVKRNKLGEIFFIFTCNSTLKSYNRLGDANIGIDFGLKTFLTLSNGEEIKSPEFYKQNIKKMKKANRSLSSKKKGSKNRKKALRELQRLHINISNQRSDFEWKLAHELCKANKLICIEDLNIAAMKKIWGRKVSDLSFSSLVEKLEQVAIKYGTTIQKIGRFYPSSKLCTCGTVNKELTLKDREWTCSSCNTTNRRDVLASNNILTEGIRLYCTKHKTSSEAV